MRKLWLVVAFCMMAVQQLATIPPECWPRWQELLQGYLHVTGPLCDARTDPRLTAFFNEIRQSGELDAIKRTISIDIKYDMLPKRPPGRISDLDQFQVLLLADVTQNMWKTRIANGKEFTHLGYVEIWDGSKYYWSPVDYLGLVRVYRLPADEPNCRMRPTLRPFQRPRKGVDAVQGLKASGALVVTFWVDYVYGQGAWWRLLFLPVPSECLRAPKSGLG